MPYIKKADRDRIDSIFNVTEQTLPQTCGELNYLFTKIILKYLEYKGESYQTYNDIIGALECCKQELYRRKIVSYENNKCKLNGEVF